MPERRVMSKREDHPDAARIQFVQDNFLDILSELDDAGTVKINCD